MKKAVIVIIILVAATGVLSYKMLSLARVECSLCLEFNGSYECTTAYGEDEAAAMDEAHRHICAKLAGGVTQTLACNNAERREIKCAQKFE